MFPLDTFVSGAGRAAVNTYTDDEGLDAVGASSAFRRAYRRRFHVPLQFYDALAFDAANIALNAVYQAAKHGMGGHTLFQRRAAVLPYVAHVRWYGAAGATTFDRNGDTNNRIVSMYRVWNGTLRFVGVAPRVVGVSTTG
jgi:ABC-type branched-subunit amino acid transport system substrate-binding protein